MNDAEYFRREKGLVLIVDIYLSEEGPSYLFRIFKIGDHKLDLVHSQACFSDYKYAEDCGLTYLNENYGE